MNNHTYFKVSYTIPQRLTGILAIKDTVLSPSEKSNNEIIEKKFYECLEQMGVDPRFVSDIELEEIEPDEAWFSDEPAGTLIN